MKRKVKISSLIDKNGFGINLFPVIYFGIENYGYSRVNMFYASWLFWEITFEFHH